MRKVGRLATGACPLGGDPAGDVDLAALLDAQRDRLEWNLNAPDEALAPPARASATTASSSSVGTSGPPPSGASSVARRHGSGSTRSQRPYGALFPSLLGYLGGRAFENAAWKGLLLALALGSPWEARPRPYAGFSGR